MSWPWVMVTGVVKVMFFQAIVSAAVVTMVSVARAVLVGLSWQMVIV